MGLLQHVNLWMKCFADTLQFLNDRVVFFNFCILFHYNRWTTALIYLFQNSVRLFLHITRAGQQGMQIFTLASFPVLLEYIRLCSFLQ